MDSQIPKSLTTCMMDTISILDEVTGMQSLERTLHKIVKNLANDLDCQTVAVIQINPKTEYLEIVNSQGLSWNFCKEYRKRIVSPRLHDLIWNGQEIDIERIDDHFDLTAEVKLENAFESCFCVALSSKHRSLGMLYVDSKESGHFDQNRKLLTRLYARIISLALMKNTLLADIQHLTSESSNDETEKYSYFYGKLQDAIARAQRLKETISLVLMDVVKFNEIVSLYGLEVTANLMQELMSSLRKNTRQYDGLSKFGTDEVIISLPGADSAQALAASLKLKDQITTTPFTNRRLNIEMSIGIANFPENANTLTGLITATKNALLEAKRSPDRSIFTSQTLFTN